MDTSEFKPIFKAKQFDESSGSAVVVVVRMKKKKKSQNDKLNCQMHRPGSTTKSNREKTRINDAKRQLSGRLTTEFFTTEFFPS